MFRSDCCRPINEDMWHYSLTRISFVEDTVVELERSHPDTIGRMLLVAHTVFPVNGDGVGLGPATGKVRPTAALHRPCCTHERTLTQHSWLRSSTGYQPWAVSGLTHVFANNGFAIATPAAFSIACFEAYESASKPFTHELPHAIMEPRTRRPLSRSSIGTTSRLCCCRSAGG